MSVLCVEFDAFHGTRIVHMNNTGKKKREAVPEVRPEEQVVKRMTIEAEETKTHVEASSTVTKRVIKESPLNRKQRNVSQDSRPEVNTTRVVVLPTVTRVNEKREDVPQDPRPKVTVEKKDPTDLDIFYNRYFMGRLLGEGGFGSVYAGVRISDGKKVALKFVRKRVQNKYITVPGTSCSLPVEIALMELVCKPPHSPFVIELLEWFESPTEFIIVLERPDPCSDLFEFAKHEWISEDMVKIIMEQVIQAALHCQARGVFHRDIKEENILINPDTLQVKLIDFGCGDLHRDTTYKKFMGTPGYFPPEWISRRECRAEPTTVWSLGVLLYSLLCGNLPFSSPDQIVYGRLRFPHDLSRSACGLIKWCLQKDPKRRPTLRQMLAHHWFS